MLSSAFRAKACTRPSSCSDIWILDLKSSTEFGSAFDIPKGEALCTALNGTDMIGNVLRGKLSEELGAKLVPIIITEITARVGGRV